MIRPRVLLAAVFLAGSRAIAQAPPPTDVYLAAITLSDRAPAGIAVATPVNITHRIGYDNQPAFTPDERAVFYTSTRDSQSDIYRYDIGSRQTTRVTSTPESEYSPTFIPGTNRFSVVRVERDSAQRLWSFEIDGSDPRLVLRTIKPVGYHAWLDSTHLALFVLGRPATLQLAEIGTERVDTIARDIGRSLAVAGPRKVSFLTPSSAGGSTLNTFDIDPATGRARVQTGLAALPSGAEYVVWTPRGDALTAAGSKLFVLRGGPNRQWAEIADLAPEGITHISRLAISPNGHWLAMVADDGR